MKKITVPLLIASAFLVQPHTGWSQAAPGVGGAGGVPAGGALPAPTPGGGVSTSNTIGGNNTFGGPTGTAPGALGRGLGGTTITGNESPGGVLGNQGDTGAAGIGLPPVVAPPVENLVPGSEGNIVFPPAENLVPGSQNQIVFPPVESLTPGGGGAAGLTPGTTNNLATGLGTGTTGTGTGTTSNLGTDLGTTGTDFLGQDRGGTSFLINPQLGLGTGAAGATIPGGRTGATGGIPGQLRGGQGGIRGDGFGESSLGAQSIVGGGTGGVGPRNTEAPGSRPGSPESITAPTEPFDADEVDPLDFSTSS